MNWPTFRHEAMATFFEIAIAGHTESYARQAAAAAWREVDRLEGELSRYVESSDIARANRIACGETIAIGDDALECLLLAAEVSFATDRAFDVTYDTARSADQAAGPHFTLDPAAHTLTSHAARLQIDLGAVGKGYALDRLADTMREWNVASIRLNSGGSTVLALAPPAGEAGWPVGLGEGPAHRTLLLADAALSGSGTAVQGAHIIDPRRRAPATRAARVWALAPTAALADALSTAFFVWTDPEIAAFCTEHPDIGAGSVSSSLALQLYGMLRRRCT